MNEPWYCCAEPTGDQLVHRRWRGDCGRRGSRPKSDTIAESSTPMGNPHQEAKLLILASKLGYQTRGFAEAAEKLGVEVVFGTDRCHKLEDPWGDGALPLHFEAPQRGSGRNRASNSQASHLTRSSLWAIGRRLRPLTRRKSSASREIRRKRWRTCRNKLRQRRSSIGGGRCRCRSFFLSRRRTIWRMCWRA